MSPHFDGETYDPAEDYARLTTQLARVVWIVTHEPCWHRLDELAQRTGSSEAGVSARLRDLRKEKFQAVYGVWTVARRRLRGGLWEYRALKTPQGTFSW